MIIENQHGFLALESAEETSFPYLRLSARIDLVRGSFAGSNDTVLFSGGDEGLRQFQALRKYETDRVRVDLTEDWFIAIQRHACGSLRVSFQIAVISGDQLATTTGGLDVEGEFGQQVVNDLWKLSAT